MAGLPRRGRCATVSDGCWMRVLSSASHTGPTMRQDRGSHEHAGEGPDRLALVLPWRRTSPARWSSSADEPAPAGPRSVIEDSEHARRPARPTLAPATATRPARARPADDDDDDDDGDDDGRTGRRPRRTTRGRRRDEATAADDDAAPAGDERRRRGRRRRGTTTTPTTGGDDRRAARPGLAGLSVRARITATVALLVALALAGAGLLVYAIESARLDDQTERRSTRRSPSSTSSRRQRPGDRRAVRRRRPRAPTLPGAQRPRRRRAADRLGRRRARDRSPNGYGRRSSTTGVPGRARRWRRGRHQRHRGPATASLVTVPAGHRPQGRRRTGRRQLPRRRRGASSTARCGPTRSFAAGSRSLITASGLAVRPAARAAAHAPRDRGGDQRHRPLPPASPRPATTTSPP